MSRLRPGAFAATHPRQGGDVAQGFLFGRPLPAVQVLPWFVERAAAGARQHVEVL